LISSFFYVCYTGTSTLVNFFINIFNLNFIYNLSYPSNNKSKTIKPVSSKLSGLYTKVSNPLIYDDVLLLSLHLQRVLKLMNFTNLNSNVFKLPFDNNSQTLNLFSTTTSKNSQSITCLLFLGTKSKFNFTEINKDNFNDKNKLFYNYVNKDTKSKLNSLPINVNTLQSHLFRYQQLFTLNLTQNLQLSKESKWLTKSSILPHDLSIKLSNITHTKKLYGNPLLNSKINLKNIWVSTRLNLDQHREKLSYNKSKMYIKNTTLKSSNFNLSNLLTLNILEESFNWIIKRFKMTQSLSTIVQFSPKNYLLKKGLYRTTESPMCISKNTFYYSLAVINNKSFSLHDVHVDFSKNSRFYQKANIKRLNSFNTDIFMLNPVDLQIANILSSNLTIHKNTLWVYSNLK